MSLFTPHWGTIFWQAVIFAIVAILLGKFAWSPLLNMMEKREKDYLQAEQAAGSARRIADELSAQSLNLLDQAKQEAAVVLEAANAQSAVIIAAAEQQAYDRRAELLTKAAAELQQYYTVSAQQWQKQIASLAIAVAEQLMRSKLSNPETQNFVAQETLRQCQETL